MPRNAGEGVLARYDLSTVNKSVRATGVNIAWAPQPGPQTALLTCPIENVLYGGARGGGKTDGALGDWLRHWRTYKKYAKGIFFRRTMPEFEELVARSHEIFSVLGAQFLAQKHTWVFPGGGFLKLRYLKKDSDAMSYQGHSYNWMCIEEAGNFLSFAPIRLLRATLRSGHGVKKRFLLTANPGGPGHNWVKALFIDPAPPMTPFLSEELSDPPSWTVFIPSKLQDNKILQEKDPEYEAKLRKSGPAWLVKAWLTGDWNIVAGGAFDDIWSNEHHILPRFKVPDEWPIYRAMDHGSSKPFSIGWWTKSNGEAVILPDGSKRSFYAGTLIRVNEWYGWNGKPNEGLRMLDSNIAKGIMEREEAMGYQFRVQAGPADASIFDVVNGNSVASEFELHGALFHPSEKGPGSRAYGLSKLREMLSAARQYPMEAPGLFVMDGCRQFVRTVPVLPRDPGNNDDVDTDAEDHVYDETRYMSTFNPPTLTAVSLYGM